MAGWIGFAGIVMLILDGIDFFQGLIALLEDEYFVVTQSGSRCSRPRRSRLRTSRCSGLRSSSVDLSLITTWAVSRRLTSFAGRIAANRETCPREFRRYGHGKKEKRERAGAATPSGRTLAAG
jgi:hypothetical protein